MLLKRRFGQSPKNKVTAASINPILEYTSWLVVAVLIGVLTGFFTLAFFKSLQVTEHLFFKTLPQAIKHFPGWGTVFIPIAGLLIIAVIHKIFPRSVRKRDLSEILKASILGTTYIRFRAMLSNLAVTVIFLGSGGTLGAEIPAAYLGAATGTLLGRFYWVPERRYRILMAAGIAAAIATIFDAALGGVFFALELVLAGNFQTLTFIVLTVAAYSARYLRAVLVGPGKILTLPGFVYQLDWDILIFAVLGILAGLLALGFVRTTRGLQSFYSQALRRWPWFWKLMPPAILLGLAGIFYPQLFGIGYPVIREISVNKFPLLFLLGLIALKSGFTIWMQAAGGYGGMIAPLLFIGAGLGALFSNSLNYLIGSHLNPTLFAVTGMGALLAGAHSMPLAAIVLLIEMTGNLQLFMPLLLATISSYLTAQLFIKDTGSAAELTQAGLLTGSEHEWNVLKNLRVGQVMSLEFHKVYATMKLKTLIKIIATGTANLYWVENEQGKIIGYISWDDLKPIITDTDNLESLVLVSDVMNPNVITITPDDSLDYILKLFSRLNISELPVIDPETGKLIGLVTRNRVIQLYNQEIFKLETADELATHLKFIDQTRFVEIDDDLALLEMKAPIDCHNLSLQKANIPHSYGIQIILIKRTSAGSHQTILTPRADLVIQPDDILVFVGQPKHLRDFQERNFN